MRKTVTLILLVFVSTLFAAKREVSRFARIEPILMLVDTPAANVVYKKTSALDRVGQLTQEEVALNSKRQTIYVNFTVMPELGLFYFEHHLDNETCCALIFGKDAKKMMENYVADPRFLSDKRDKELSEAATDYLEAAPGRSLSDPEWQRESARLEAIFKAYVEATIKPLYQRAVVLDRSADGNEIVLFGGSKLCTYSKVVNVETLRDFMVNAKMLTETIIVELKVSRQLPKSTLKQLDALATLAPKEYGMSK